jgi:hypothetical protein
MSPSGYDFTTPNVKTSSGEWEPQYSYGYGARWVSGWSFKPTKQGGGGRGQTAASIGETAQQSDLAKPKKPKPVLGEQQIVAQAGDTVPIVFGARISNVGGVWVQPALVKTGSQLFSSINVFALSQGNLAGAWNHSRMWSGNRNFQYTDYLDNAPVFQDYISAAASAASPTTCPIGGRVFCDFDVYSFAGNTQSANGGTVRLPDIANNYYRQYEITQGTGDTDNSVIRYNNSDTYIYDSKTGNDVTAAYWAYVGINPVGTYTYINAVYSGSTIVGGRIVGLVQNITPPGLVYAAPTGAVPYSTGPVVFVYGSGTLLNRINPALPTDTGTLYGITTEWGISPYANPNSPPSTENFTNYSDITFLQVWADLFDPNEGPRFSSSFPADYPDPTNFKQLSVFYSFGVTVDLYSVGLVSGAYLTGASRHFVDLAMYLFTIMKRANGASTFDLASPINVDNLPLMAVFCTNNQMFFNGIVDQSVNVIDYITTTAPYFFLAFVSDNGQYSLQALLPADGTYNIKTTALTPAMTFSEANILPGSFQKKYFSTDEQRPTVVSLLWREADPANVSIQRTTTVRYPETDANAPIVQFDMTDFCTTSTHAAIYGKYELARRRYSTHAISFDTPLLTTSLIPTQIIKVERQRTNSRGDDRLEINWYQITRVRHSVDGVSSIEAAHFPVNGSDIAIINNEIVNGTFTVV